MRKPEIIEVLNRSQEGEYCTVKEWDIRRIPKEACKNNFPF